MSQPDPEPSLIEVGRTAEDGLRLWRANEAVRHAELQLTAQTANLAAFETRATSLLSWCVTAGLAMVVIGRERGLLWPSCAASACLFVAAACCIAALWPHVWHMAGDEPENVLNWTQPSELEAQEALAGGYGLVIAENDAAVRRRNRIIRAAWVAFLLAPAAASGVLLAQA